MDKFKKWFKNNKKKSIVIGIISLAAILFLIFMIGVISYLMPNKRKSVYGDRCEVTKNHPVASDRESTLKDFIKEYDSMEVKSVRSECNLIDVIVEVDDKVNISDVKKMGKKMLEKFSDDELKYYDIQLIVKSNNESSDAYPIIGTHHKEIDGSSNDNFVW